MVDMAPRIAKKKWAKFYGIISKSGDVELAARKSRIGTNQTARMMATYPNVKRKVHNALASYRKKVDEGRIGHDRPGRPKVTFSEATKERFLYCLGEMGSVRGAANAVGVSTGSLYRLKEREPDFAAAWDVAAKRGENVAIIAGPWARREQEFTDALPNFRWDMRAATDAAAIPVRLAEILHDRLTPRHVLAERHPALVVKATSTAANSNPLPPEIAEAEARLTPEMKRFLEVYDCDLPLEEAVARAKFSLDDVRAWQEENAYFGSATSD
jgi:hypothetical protein